MKLFNKIVKSETAPQNTNDIWFNNGIFKTFKHGNWEATSGMISTTYNNLVSLRDAGQLNPSMFYRITDYVTTTAQESSVSAGHQFDIIVLALTANKLSEQAHAAIHEGDTYFSETGANLSAWKIWYYLDNDVEKFAWAFGEDDTCVKITGLNQGTDYNLTLGLVVKVENSLGENYEYDFEYAGYPYSLIAGNIFNEYGELVGTYSEVSSKGVIYRMIDEWGNDCPYDFKNILFKKEVDGEEIYIPTFGENCAYNKIEPRTSWYGGDVLKMELPFNTFGVNCEKNYIGFSAKNNTFKDYITSCHLGVSANDNVISSDCNNIYLKNHVNNCFFYDECSHIVIGSGSRNILFNDITTCVEIGMACESLSFSGGDNIVVTNNVRVADFEAYVSNVRVMSSGSYINGMFTQSNVFIGFDQHGNVVQTNIFAS